MPSPQIQTNATATRHTSDGPETAIPQSSEIRNYPPFFTLFSELPQELRWTVFDFAASPSANEADIVTAANLLTVNREARSQVLKSSFPTKIQLSCRTYGSVRQLAVAHVFNAEIEDENIKGGMERIEQVDILEAPVNPTELKDFGLIVGKARSAHFTRKSTLQVNLSNHFLQEIALPEAWRTLENISSGIAGMRPESLSYEYRAQSAQGMSKLAQCLPRACDEYIHRFHSTKIDWSDELHTTLILGPTFSTEITITPSASLARLALRTLRESSAIPKFTFVERERAARAGTDGDVEATGFDDLVTSWTTYYAYHAGDVLPVVTFVNRDGISTRVPPAQT